MKWWNYSILFIAGSLWATVNEPLRLEWLSGYRNDRIHWHLQDPGEGGTLLYSEIYRDVAYWENGLRGKVIHRDLTFYLSGSYGAFGKGTLFQRPPDRPSTSQSTTGWVADGSGYFGYAVNLTADRVYKVILTPLIGYSAHFEALKPEALRIAWYGFYFGGEWIVEPGNNFVLHAGYAYHLLHNDFRTCVQGETFSSVKANSTGAIGQTGWAQVDFIAVSSWRFGLGAQLHYFSTRFVNASVEENGGGIASQTFKLRWTAVSGWAQISKEF